MIAIVRKFNAMAHIGFRWFAMCLSVVLILPLAPRLHAETLPILPIAWSPLYPLIHEGQNGELMGFMVDLAHELGREVGFEPDFFRVADIYEWGEAQKSGASVLLLGGAETLPSLAQNYLFSTPVFEAEVALAVRSADADKIDLTRLAGLRIGTLSLGAGSEPGLYPTARMINYPSVNAALFGLLADEVDAVSMPSLFVFSAARKLGVDYRITFLGAPALPSGRYVAIHKSHSGLLNPVNAALARMKADGRLGTFLAKHDVVVPENVPEILTVGVADLPPYTVYDEEGTFTGFAVEVLSDLADLAGLNIQYKAISNPEFAAGPTAQTYDILPAIGVNEARAETMDFALAVERSAYAIFTRAGQAEGLSDLDSLIGRTVGVETVSLGRRLAESHGGLTLRVIDGRSALLQQLSEGMVDVIVFPSTAMNKEINAQGLTGEIAEVTPPFHISTRAPALRRGLGAVRERLNAVIPGYLISDEYAALRDKWFGVPVFWTERRIYSAAGLAGLVFLGVAALHGWGQHRQQQQQQLLERQKAELDREQRYSSELARLVAELERSNGELDNFAYVASHDLKEPLRGIAINADFLLREEVSEEGAERVKRMVHLTSRMEQLISDLLFFSRLGRADKAKTDVNTADLIDGIRTGLREMLEETGSTIEVAPGLPFVHAEPAKIKIVFQNLIVNGLKYNDAEKKLIQIGFLSEAEAGGRTLKDVFFLRDNGVGIASKEHEKIFRIFTRLNREADYGRGTGAGLSFVKKIIEEYGGVVALTSEPGNGTTFYFSLPVVELSAQKNLEQTGV